MSLPKIDLPIYDVKIASYPEPIKFRPFLVKEEKLLLMALEANNDDEVLKAVKQIINNCLVSQIDVDTLPIFDIEYLFLNLRARSVGEKVEAIFVCRNVVGRKPKEKEKIGAEFTNAGQEIVTTEPLENVEEEEIECGTMNIIDVNILEIDPPTHNTDKRIHLTNDIGLELKYPTFGSMKTLNSLLFSDKEQDLYELIYNCCEYVFDKNGVYYTKETSKEEFINFLENLTQDHLDKIVAFFANMPNLTKQIQYTCSKCKFEHKTILEGLSDFFI